MKPGIIIICGPTATGKTACAIDVANGFSGEVVNADSMQVYRRMEIGTAKPTKDERAQVRFHLVDVAYVDETFSTGRFCELAHPAIRDICYRERLPVISGGTGLYLKALTHGIFEGPKADRALRDNLKKQEEETPGSLHEKLNRVDPEKASRLPPSDIGRIIRALEVYELTGIPLTVHQKKHAFSEHPYLEHWIGLALPREQLYERINQRVIRMMESGWVEEERELIKSGFDENSAAANALGYRTLLLYLKGKCTKEQAIEQIQRETRKFAKRQLTWYRANDKIHWFEYPKDREAILNSVQKALLDWKG